mmetsp:Transcript_25979/g.53153  ORF Transcript_25979/g.53153 Transcript_25979/m.53153 type:complete len:223 (+) Transcript_25979:1487-2155(+)
MASGRPSRTTRMPTLAHPSTRLSTAMLESEVARMGLGPRPPRSAPASLIASLAQCFRMRMATAVLPVPGGPWTRVRRFVAAPSTASRWEALSPSIAPYFSRARRDDSRTACSSTMSSPPLTPSFPECSSLEFQGMARAHSAAVLVSSEPRRSRDTLPPCSITWSMFSSMAVIALISSGQGRLMLARVTCITPLGSFSEGLQMLTAAANWRLNPIRLASLSIL